jgi:diacylglycerol kinase (ATP)
MNVARALGIPFDLDEAARVLARSDVRKIDVGEANGEVFFEAVSVGLNAAVFGEAQRIDEGRWASIVDMVRFGLRYPPHRMWIDLDGRRQVVRALTLAVLNGPYTGLGLTLAPDARLDDGLLDVAIFEGMSRWALAVHLLRVLGGRRAPAPGIRRDRARRIRVTARHGLPVRCDATDLGSTPVDVRVRPRELLVVAPPAGEPRPDGTVRVRP